MTFSLTNGRRARQENLEQATITVYALMVSFIYSLGQVVAIMVKEFRRKPSKD